MKNIFFKACLLILNVILLIACTTKEEDLYRIKVDNKVGFIDSSGNIKIKPQYLQVGTFNEGLCMVVIDTLPIKREITAAKTYTSYWDIPRKKYKAWTEYEEIIRYGYIDRNNKFVINPTLIYKKPKDYFQKANMNFSQGLAIFQDTSMRYGYINKNGVIAIPAKYVTASTFSDSLAVVSIEVKENENKYGYIDLNGNPVIDFKYSWASSFSEGYAVARYDWYPNSTDMNKENYLDERQEAMVINKKGNVVGRPFGGFNLFSEFNNGFALEVNTALNFCRFVSNKGVIATGMLEKARPFSDGLAPVFSGGKWGLVDTSFKFVIPPIYNNCDFYSEGLIPVKKGSLWGYVNYNNKTILPFRYDSCSSFQNSRAKFKISRDGYVINGYIDKSGNVIWQKEVFTQK